MSGPDDGNPASPPPGLRLCGLGELADPGSRGFRFREGQAMFAGFVVRQGGAIRGFRDSCPHAGWPLAMQDDYLTRDGRYILCSAHGAIFTLDGVCAAGPCRGERLKPWAVELRGDAVFTA